MQSISDIMIFKQMFYKLEQLERLRSEDTPTASWLPIPLSHIGSQVKRRQSQSYKLKKKSPKFQFFKFWNRHYTRHTFWSCFIRCANMKWIRWVFLKIQSGHDSVHRRTDRRTDGQGDTSIPPFQLRWSGGIIIFIGWYMSNQGIYLHTFFSWYIHWHYVMHIFQSDESLNTTINTNILPNMEAFNLQFIDQEYPFFIRSFKFATKSTLIHMNR